MTANILFAVTSDNYVRNYLRTDALSSLSRKFEIDIVASDSLELKRELENRPDFRGFFQTDPIVSQRHDLLFSLLMWRNRKKSDTFRYRWIRNAGWDRVTAPQGTVKKIAAFLKWLPGALLNPKGLRIVVLASPLLFPLSRFLLQRRLPINLDLERIVRAKHYALIIFPSAAFDSVTIDLTRLAARYGSASLCLIDNWDNLTSKTSFWLRPDHLGVWGAQTKEQAVRIHGFKPSQVHAIGTPRFDQYFLTRREAQTPAPGENPYLLFVGSAMPFDELGALKTLEEILDEELSKDSKLEVIYRPHPWQQKRNCPTHFDQAAFSRTRLDPQINAAYESGFGPETTDPAFQPQLDYYPGLFAGAKAVLGPLTTMLFEASLSLRPVVGLAYDDGFHSNTSRRYFTHFDGVEKIPGFTICEKASDLKDTLIRALSLPPIRENDADRATKYFLHRTADGYPNQLAALVGEITGERAATDLGPVAGVE